MSHESQLAEWERDLLRSGDEIYATMLTDGYEYENDPHYFDNHPNNIAYARSQEDHVYDYDQPAPVRVPDPAFAAIRPILRYLPSVWRATDPSSVTDVESLADFLLTYNKFAQDENYSLRETITELRYKLDTAETRNANLDHEVRRLTAQIELAAKYPGETVESVVLSICKDQGLGTDNFRAIPAIKDVRALLHNSLKEAKDLVDAAKASYVPRPEAE